MSTFSDIQTKLRHFDSPFLNRKYSVATVMFCLIWKSWQISFCSSCWRYNCLGTNVILPVQNMGFFHFFPLCVILVRRTNFLQVSATKTNYQCLYDYWTVRKFFNIEFSGKTSFQPIGNKNIYMRKVSKQSDGTYS